MSTKLNPIFSRLALGLSLVGVFTNAHATDEPFNVSMTLLAPLTITELTALSFVDTNAGSATTVVTAPSDALAASFSATGTPLDSATGSVVEASITMTTGGGGATEQIVVDTFTTGGDMDAAGATTFDAAGNIADLRVGGTANIDATDVAGIYSGTATFRLIY